MSAHPTATWRILEWPIARDGDSIYLVREREIGRDEDDIWIRRDANRVLCRATWLACPEISGPNKDPINGPRATRDAQDWLDGQWFEYGTLLTAVQYGFEKYGRPLVDIRSPEGSFSVWMASPKANDGHGWDVYR